MVVLFRSSRAWVYFVVVVVDIKEIVVFFLVKIIKGIGFFWYGVCVSKLFFC